jgi:hypothetical protein
MPGGNQEDPTNTEPPVDEYLVINVPKPRSG